MVIIAFSNGSDWYKANWAFRQLAADAARNTTDPEELHALELGAAFGLLDLEEATDLSSRLVELLRITAKQTLNGEIADLLPDDPSGRALYREAIAELLETINKLRA